MADLPRTLKVHCHDTSISAMQDDPNDPTFRIDIFVGCVRHLRQRGWRVVADPDVRKRYPSISKNYRIAHKGNLRAHLESMGRSFKIEFWSEAARRSNRNGPRYDFDRRERMGYLDRLRFDLEQRKLIDWLGSAAQITVTKSIGKKAKAKERIAKAYAESWHSDKDLGRPVCEHEYNARSADGDVIEHGCTVWHRGHDGRWRRGQAFYHINNMWWVVEDQFTLRNIGSFQLYRHQPQDLRDKRHPMRRKRLEELMARALVASDFGRAETIKRVIFGDQAPHYIWSRKNDAYYAPQYQGYTSNLLTAGRYTQAEAEAECRRVPHILEMVCPDGRRVRFDAEAAHG